jgi:hypothetical protein
MESPSVARIAAARRRCHGHGLPVVTTAALPESPFPFQSAPACVGTRLVGAEILLTMKTMKSSPSSLVGLATVVAWIGSACLAVTVFAAEPVPSVQDVEDARRCASATRVAGHAFGEVRDSVQAGGTTRAEALLTAAEESLAEARSACAGNAEVSADLELLARQTEGLRGALAARGR